MHSHLFQKAARRKRLKKTFKAVSRTPLSAHFKLDWHDMKKSQKQWKINSFQKSPFGEALLIATKSAVKSVRQFGNQPIEKAATTREKKKKCLSKSKCTVSRLGSGFFPFRPPTFWISTILYFLLFIQFFFLFSLMMCVIKLPSTGKSFAVFKPLMLLH